MTIKIYKFGTVLVSRPAGKEAWLAYQPILNTIKSNENIIVDFADVSVLTPSWADEFSTSLLKRFGDRVAFRNTKNPSVTATLKILQIK